MRDTGGLWKGWLAAFALAAVTLGVFATLHDYGPESAIRRFHVASVRGDLNELSRVTAQSPNSPSVLKLRQWVGTMHQLGAHYQLLRIDRQTIDRDSSDALAALLYNTPGQENWGMVWIVSKRNSVWKVDADRTANLARNLMFGLPRDDR